MIFLERTIDIKKGVGSIDEPVILYKGDKNVEIQFTIKNNPFKSKKSLTPTYGQLVIDREATSIFSDVSSLNNGKVIFVITEQMIDELIEIGEYAFQIRLFNDDKTSRATLPVINGGIIIKQPICDGEENVANINKATVNDAIIPYSEPESVFNQDGNYNKTIWADGDLITDSKLNKVEDALDYLVTESKTHATEQYVQDAVKNIEVSGGIDLSGYATKEDIDNLIPVIDKTGNPEGILYEDFEHGSGAYKLSGSFKFNNHAMQFGDDLVYVIKSSGLNKSLHIFRCASRANISTPGVSDYVYIDYVNNTCKHDNYATESYVDSIITVIDKIEIGFDDLPDGDYACYLKGNLEIRDLNGNKLTFIGDCGNEIVQINKMNTDTTKKVYVYTMENKYLEIDIINGTVQKSRYDVSKEYVDQKVKGAVNTMNATLGDIERLLGGI